MLQGVDALITKEPGCCICISTADCIPILLYDRKNQVVAAAHAGWRGTVNYISRTYSRQDAAVAPEPDGKDVIACISRIWLFFVKWAKKCTKLSRTALQSDFMYQKWNPETREHPLDLWVRNRMQLLDFGVPGEQISTY